MRGSCTRQHHRQLTRRRSNLDEYISFFFLLNYFLFDIFYLRYGLRIT